MKLTLKKKNDSSDKDPLVVMMDHPEDHARDDKKRPGKHAKLICKVKIGETIDVATAFEGHSFSKEKAEELGYHIMSRYPGLFVQGSSTSPAEKSKKSYEDKAYQVQL